MLRERAASGDCRQILRFAKDKLYSHGATLCCAKRAASGDCRQILRFAKDKLYSHGATLCCANAQHLAICHQILRFAKDKLYSHGATLCCANAQHLAIAARSFASRRINFTPMALLYAARTRSIWRLPPDPSLRDG